MTSSLLEKTSRAKARRGFTLVELIVSSSLAAILLTGVLTTFVALGKSAVRTGNYSVMESQTRRAFEQLGIDARMASAFISNFTGSTITSITLTIPSSDLSTISQVTYGYSNKTMYVVPGSDPAATAGRRTLLSNVNSLTFLRYDSSGNLVPTSITSDATVKHVQVSVTVIKSQTGVAAATQVIRSTSFTMRNISI